MDRINKEKTLERKVRDIKTIVTQKRQHAQVIARLFVHPRALRVAVD
jgi:hypothetical protein